MDGKVLRHVSHSTVRAFCQRFLSELRNSVSTDMSKDMHVRLNFIELDTSLVVSPHSGLEEVALRTRKNPSQLEEQRPATFNT